MKVKDPQTVFLGANQLQAWEARMQERMLPDAAGDFAILQALVRSYLFLVEALSAARVSVARLKRWLFGSKSEKGSNILRKSPDPADGKGTADGSAPDGAGKDHPETKGKKPKRKGHGRNGAGAYPDAKRTPVPHTTFVPGCPCPTDGCKGKLYLKPPRVVLRVFGQPSLVGRIWEQGCLRCNLCGERFFAPLPVEARGPTYDVTAVAMIAILHFGNGFPFNRLAQLQVSLQMPVPASDQCELLSEAFQKLLPVFNELIRQAAQCEIVHNDDTGMKILALLVQIKKSQAQGSSGAESSKGQRTGIHTTAIVAISLVLSHRIVLYFTGPKHAGENLAFVLEHRDPKLDPPIHESDGLDYNAPGTARVITAKCLTHGRRQFADIIVSFPDQCRRVVEDIAKVYHVDTIAKESKLSPEERLLLHQKESGPVMESLHQWMVDQLQGKAVEPNSGLGKAIKYMLKRWEALTLFLRKAGAPLDNNITERALKRAIRLRKNSLFYKTQKGAAVGDMFLSFIETCALNDVNTFHYLTTLLRNAHRLKDSPGFWMPWNYQAMLLDEDAAGEGHATTSSASLRDSGADSPSPRRPPDAKPTSSMKTGSGSTAPPDPRRRDEATVGPAPPPGLASARAAVREAVPP